MLSQDQRSVTDQLNDLVTLANKHGLYDAADWLKSTLEESRPSPTETPNAQT